MDSIFVISQASSKEETEYTRDGDWYRLAVSPQIYALKNNKSDAEWFVINNTTDLNEAGCYPYVTIEEYPMGAITGVEHTWVYEWNEQKGIYELLTSHNDSLTLVTSSKGAGCYE